MRDQNKSSHSDKARVGEALAVSTLIKPLQDFAQQKAGTYRKSFKPKYARFKLKFWKRDGTTEVRFSYDFYSRYLQGQKKTIVDESEGLVKLLRLIDKRQYEYFTAVIFCKTSQNMSTDVHDYNYPLYVFVNNQLMQAERLIDFKHNEKGFLVLEVNKLPKEPKIKTGKEPQELSIGKTFKDHHAQVLKNLNAQP